MTKCPICNQIVVEVGSNEINNYFLDSTIQPPRGYFRVFDTWYKGVQLEEECMQYSGSELVSYSQNNLQVETSSGGVGNCIIPTNDYYHWHEHWYPVFYPTYHLVENKNRTEQAFKIVAKMLENKIITKELTVKNFIKLVNDIAEIL